MRKVVLLPQPDGPRMQSTSELHTPKETSSTARRAPKLQLTWQSVNPFVGSSYSRLDKCLVPARSNAKKGVIGKSFSYKA